MSLKHLPTQHRGLLIAAILSSGFFLSMSTGLVLYINSSFLEAFVSARYVGVVFSLAYIATIVVMQNYGRLISRFGNSYVLYANMLAQLGALLVMAKSTSPWLVLPAFVAFIIAAATTIVNYDIYLKELATVHKTGRLRGIFWTVVNAGILVSPFTTGKLLAFGGFPLVYLVSAILIVPAVILMYVAYNGNRYRIPYRKHEGAGKTLRRIWKDRNMRGIFLIALALYLFYSWMVIYTPLYLLEAGFSWSEITVMFTFMLIPFVLVEYPAGYVADTYFGETEMLTIGLGIMAVSVFTFMVVDTFIGMMIVLFCSRVGASLVEIMRESYFYKTVKSGDLDMIDTFRNTGSFAYVLGPIIATGLMAAGLPFAALFFVLAFVLVFAAVLPGTIRDTL